jgi:hypothetical protein
MRRPITPDQELMAAVLEELKRTNLLLTGIAQTLRGETGVECPECGQTFVNERALRAHMGRSHKGVRRGVHV